MEEVKTCEINPMKQKSPNHKKRKVESLEPTSPPFNPDCMEIPLLYKEDTGTDGIKVHNNRSCSIMMSGVERGFQVPITSEEKKRRKERQARFFNNVKKTKSFLDDEPDGIGDSLTESHKASIRLETKQTLSAEAKLSNGKKRPGVTDASSPNKKSYHALVGTNQNLEKPYLRLTTSPKAEDVRPLEVLIKSLARIKSRYIQDEHFEWANEQLKSVRQDLTVQGLRNKFVLDVYETHARILLEHGDLSEFNQCQTMIRTLTSSSCGSWIPGENDCNDADIIDEGIDSKCRPSDFEQEEQQLSRATLTQSEEAVDEFASYGLLYALVQHSNVAFELVRTLCLVQHDEQTDGQGHKPQRRHARLYLHSSKASSCRHALQVVKAVVHNDYRGFFRLYESAPHLSAYLMDFLVKRVRDAAYERIVRAYRPTISVEFFREALHFPNLKETRSFLRNSGAVFVEEFWVDCKASK